MPKKTDLIAYCGVYCPDCPSYTQEVADLAKDLRSYLRRQKFGKHATMLAKMPTFKAFKHYDKGYELLDAMTKIRCKGACRQGGGGANCPIKKCAKKKRLLGCWKCDDFPTCKTLKVLEQYGDTNRLYLKNLRKIKRIGPAAFVRAKSS